MLALHQGNLETVVFRERLCIAGYVVGQTTRVQLMAYGMLLSPLIKDHNEFALPFGGTLRGAELSCNALRVSLGICQCAAILPALV